jgi:hypothetical protein
MCPSYHIIGRGLSFLLKIEQSVLKACRLVLRGNGPPFRVLASSMHAGTPSDNKQQHNFIHISCYEFMKILS